MGGEVANVFIESTIDVSKHIVSDGSKFTTFKYEVFFSFNFVNGTLLTDAFITGELRPSTCFDGEAMRR